MFWKSAFTTFILGWEDAGELADTSGWVFQSSLKADCIFVVSSRDLAVGVVFVQCLFPFSLLQRLDVAGEGNFLDVFGFFESVLHDPVDEGHLTVVTGSISPITSTEPGCGREVYLQIFQLWKVSAKHRGMSC